MNIAIIGAGPAGIISARNAIKAGHSVVLFEKNTRIGGIWTPWSGGAYRNACMQNSRYTFHYTGKRKLTAVCSHQTRIGNLDAHLTQTDI